MPSITRVAAASQRSDWKCCTVRCSAQQAGSLARTVRQTAKGSPSLACQLSAESAGAEQPDGYGFRPGAGHPHADAAGFWGRGKQPAQLISI